MIPADGIPTSDAIITVTNTKQYLHFCTIMDGQSLEMEQESARVMAKRPCSDRSMDESTIHTINVSSFRVFMRMDI